MPLHDQYLYKRPRECNNKISLVMRKPAFCICEKKTQNSFAVTAKLISAFVFATRIVQSLCFLYTKFQASSHLAWLYSLVCVGPGRKTRRPVFSQRGSNNTTFIHHTEEHNDNTLIQYTVIFHGCKNDYFHIKIMIYFLFLLKT